MRFHTTHMMVCVAVAALAFAVVRQPDVLRAAVVPLVAGVFVVLPTLGVIEFLSPRSHPHPQVGWGAVVLAVAVALLGSALMILVGAHLLLSF